MYSEAHRPYRRGRGQSFGYANTSVPYKCSPTPQRPLGDFLPFAVLGLRFPRRSMFLLFDALTKVRGKGLIFIGEGWRVKGEGWRVKGEGWWVMDGMIVVEKSFFQELGARIQISNHPLIQLSNNPTHWSIKWMIASLPASYNFWRISSTLRGFPVPRFPLCSSPQCYRRSG